MHYSIHSPAKMSMDNSIVNLVVINFFVYDLRFIDFRLPEVPPDTAETNSLMRVHELPSFSKIFSQ